MRMIDADAFREEYALAERCEDCPRCGKKDCDYPNYSARDFCGWLDDAPTIGGWISVSDRLPDNNSTVLAWESQGFAFVDTWEYGSFKVGDNNGANITHWMPLPEPPEEVSGDAN